MQNGLSSKHELYLYLISLKIFCDQVILSYAYDVGNWIAFLLQFLHLTL